MRVRAHAERENCRIDGLINFILSKLKNSHKGELFVP